MIQKKGNFPLCFFYYCSKETLVAHSKCITDGVIVIINYIQFESRMLWLQPYNRKLWWLVFLLSFLFFFFLRRWSTEVLFPLLSSFISVNLHEEKYIYILHKDLQYYWQQMLPPFLLSIFLLWPESVGGPWITFGLKRLADINVLLMLLRCLIFYYTFKCRLKHFIFSCYILLFLHFKFFILFISCYRTLISVI